MNEILFALFILVGFLSGSLLFGHAFYFSIYSLPSLMQVGSNDTVGSAFLDLIRKIYPLVLWLLITGIITFLINKYFNFYIKLFYCGLAISLIFTVGELLNRNKQQ